MSVFLEKPKKKYSFELIAAIIMGIIAIICFVSQIYFITPKTTQLETVLINLLELFLTIGFAWFSSRAISKKEFESSIKQFAISAYRRILDIDKMLGSLQQELLVMKTNIPANEYLNLQVIGAIVSDTIQVVKSSMDDWTDVIGPEIIYIQNIRRLEHERNRI